MMQTAHELTDIERKIKDQACEERIEGGDSPEQEQAVDFDYEKARVRQMVDTYQPGAAGEQAQHADAQETLQQ